MSGPTYNPLGNDRLRREVVTSVDLLADQLRENATKRGIGHVIRCLLNDAAAALTAERKRADALTEAIRQAPHGEDCDAEFYSYQGLGSAPCDCWKASVLSVPAEQP